MKIYSSTETKKRIEWGCIHDSRSIEISSRPIQIEAHQADLWRGFQTTVAFTFVSPARFISETLVSAQQMSKILDRVAGWFPKDSTLYVFAESYRALVHVLEAAALRLAIAESPRS